MNKNLYRLIICFVACFPFWAIAQGHELEPLLETLDSGGIANFMAYVKDGGVLPPSIPSLWNVENRTKTVEEQRVKTRIRAFGFALAESVEKTIENQRQLNADESLYQWTETLCDFADWCATTPGWGNQVLANHSLEQVAAISTRLIANTNFPIERCEKIVERLSPEWLGPRGRAAAMNADVETNLFHLAMVDSNEELDMACGAGWFLMTFEGKPIPEGYQMPRNKSLNVLAAKANLDFFLTPSVPSEFQSPKASWEERLFVYFRGGFGWDVYRRAEALLQFRKTLGGFPQKFMRSPQEEEHLKQRIKLAEEFGAKVVRVEDKPDYDPLKEGFIQAWDKRPNRDISQQKIALLAFSAYKRVISGAFSPLDKREEE